MKIFKPKFWQSRGNLFCFLLLPFSLAYQLLLFIKDRISLTKKFNLQVLCIGNIYIGGTGKTPLSILINNELKKNKKKVVIIKKHYKSHKDEHNLILKETGSLILEKTRSQALSRAEEKGYDIAILDDGFQDPTIYKNLNILCFNSRQLIGNGLTLPSGPLREKFNSIKKAEIIIINGKKNKIFERKIFDISKNIKIYYSKYVPYELVKIKNRKILAFAGIGNPSNFFELLTQDGFKIIKKMSFPDHYNYSKEELKNIINYSKKNKLEVVTTEKDYFRIKKYGFKKIKYLRVKLEILKKHKLMSQILKSLR